MFNTNIASRIFYIISIVMAISIGCIGQVDSIPIEPEVKSDQLELGLIHKHYGDSIVLRWAPSRIDGWITGMNNGYSIHRQELNDEFEPIGDWDTLLSPLIKPYTVEKFREEITKYPNDHFLAAAAESMYGFQLEYTKDISNYNVFDLADEYNDRYSICLIAADLSGRGAEGLGWKYTDKKINKKSKYIYRVFVPGEDSISLQLDISTLAEVDTNEIFSPIIHEVVEKETQVDLKLSRELNDKYFTAYYVERSNNDGKSWLRLTDIPYVQPLTDHKIGNRDYIVYRDTGLVNYVLYQYRFIGLNAFGETSPPSEPVKGMGRDRTPPRIPNRIMAKMNEKMQMEIQWEYDVEPVDIGSFVLARSKRPYDPQSPVHEGELKPNARSYVDVNPNTIANNFYTLYVLDTAQNISYTQATFGSYTDSLPPAPPSGLTYEIDTTGKTVISWDLGKEEDLLGYHVYFANSKRHYLANVSNLVIQDTIFRDTFDLQSLTETGFYRITALDFNYNVSEFSEWLEVIKPDIVAPSSPIITKHKSHKDGIAIYYVESSSRDVEYYLLQREKGSKWIDVSTIESIKSTGVLLDSTDMEMGALYRYRIRAVDDAGNVSKLSYNYTARSKLPTLVGKIETFEVVAEKKKAILQWKYIGRDSDLVKLYRAADGGQFKLIRTFNASNRTGKDYTVHNKEHLEYRIVLETRDGIVLDTSPARNLER
jgi:hypothetical protein